MSAEAKLKILEEARQPNTTVAEVLRRHQLDATTLYRWEREAKAGMLAALGEKPKTSDALARENARLRAELDKKSRIIAEVVEENLAHDGNNTCSQTLWRAKAPPPRYFHCPGVPQKGGAKRGRFLAGSPDPPSQPNAACARITDQRTRTSS